MKTTSKSFCLISILSAFTGCAQVDPGRGRAQTLTVEPASGPGGSLVTVTGSGFQDGDFVQLSSATLGTLALTTVSLSSSVIVALLPSGDVLPPGPVGIQARRHPRPTAPDPTPTPTPTAPFTVTPGRTFYISPTGSDSNAGTLAAPWARPDTAAARMQPGDLTYVRAGTYSGSYTITQSGKSGSPLTFRAYPGEKPLLVNPASSPYSVTLVAIGSYLTFDGLRVSNDHVPGNGVEIDAGTHDVTFSNGEVFNVKGNGIIISGTNNLVTGSSIHDVAVDGQHNHCIYIEGASNTIRKNVIYNAKYYGVHLYSGKTDVSGGHNLIEQNLIYHNGYGTVADGYSHSTAGIILADQQPATIVRNNVLCDNANYALYVNYYMPDNQVTGNVSCYNKSGGFYMEGAGTNLSFTNNISYNDAAPAMMGMPGVTGDYNTYWKAGSTPQLQWQWTGYTLAAYQKAFSQELHSKIADPVFTNPPVGSFDDTKATSYNFCTSLNSALCN
jgi:hypothetical protein